MKIHLDSQLKNAHGKPAVMQDEPGSPLRPLTVRDIILQVASSQAGSDAKQSFMLHRLANAILEEKPEVELSSKLSDVLVKLAKNPTTSKGEPIISALAHAQLMEACGLTEEDL